MNQSTTGSSYQEMMGSLLSQGKTVKTTVWGMSMFPFLLTGDVVLVKPVGPRGLRYGQVVVFRNAGKWVVHRLVGQDRHKGLVFTRGDGLAKKDKPVMREEVVGVVTGISRSRLFLAKLAIGLLSPVLAFLSPVTGPLFYLVAGVLGRQKAEGRRQK